MGSEQRASRWRARISAVASLDEPTRQRLYAYVVGRLRPVGRDEAAAAAGIPRTTAAFHLDRLVDEGLLDVVFERRGGRRGPGAGRPAKLYLRAARDVAVTLPERHYELAGELLAAAVEESDTTGRPPGVVLERLARERGRQLAADARESGASAEERAVEQLAASGFEPHPEDGATVLVNCPFHALAQTHTALVCGMTFHLVTGLLDELGASGLTAQLRPRPGRCCVWLVGAPG